MCKKSSQKIAKIYKRRHRVKHHNAISFNTYKIRPQYSYNSRYRRNLLISTYVSPRPPLIIKHDRHLSRDVQRQTRSKNLKVMKIIHLYISFKRQKIIDGCASKNTCISNNKKPLINQIITH